MDYIIDSFHVINNQKPGTILYLHGWGTNYSTMTMLYGGDEYNHLYVDLPNFGSNSQKDCVLTLEEYASIINKFTENYKIEYIVSHSFGGKIAVLLAKLMQNLKGLILIAPSIYPKKRRLKYYSKITWYKFLKKTKLLKYFENNSFGSIDYQNASENMKKTLLNVINRDVTNELSLLMQPTLLLFSNEDEDTPLYLAKKIKDKMFDCEIITINGNHFAYQNQFTYINAIIKAFVKAVDNIDLY